MSKPPQHDRNRRDAKALGVKWISPTDREILRGIRREADAAHKAQIKTDAERRAERARESATLRLAFLRKYAPRSPERAALELELA